MSAPDKIWLQPECCAGDEGQLWCEDPDPVDCEDGEHWTPYSRSTPAREAAEELVGMLEIIVFNALMISDPQTCGHTDTYSVPLDDIDAARDLIAALHKAEGHE